MTASSRRSRRGTRTTDGSRERGSIAIEMAFLVPVLLLILALVWAYGRVAWANGHLDSGTRDAARVATQARSLPEAREAAERVVREAAAAVPECQNTVEVELSGDWSPGSTITVTASCRYRLDGIGLPGAPGEMNPTAQFSSVLDRHRGVDR